MIKIDSNFSIYLFFLCLSLIISILFYYLIIPNIFDYKYNLILPDSQRYFEQIYSYLNQLKFRGYFNINDINSFLDIYIFVLYNFNSSFFSIIFINCIFVSTSFFLLYLILYKLTKQKFYSLIASLIVLLLPSNLQFTTQILKDTFVQFSIILIFYTYTYLIDVIINPKQYNKIYIALFYLFFPITINIAFFFISITRPYFIEVLILILIIINIFILFLNYRNFVSFFHSIILIFVLALNLVIMVNFIYFNISNTEENFQELKQDQISNNEFQFIYKNLQLNKENKLDIYIENERIDDFFSEDASQEPGINIEKEKLKKIINNEPLNKINGLCITCAPNYNNWNYSSFIPLKLENILMKIAENRYNFISSGGLLISDKNLYSVSDFIKEIPKTVVVSFLYPLPNFSINKQLSKVSKLKRIIASLEMIIFYISYLGFIYFIFLNKFNPILYPPITISFLSMYLYSTVIMNMGTLYRIRSVFLIYFISIGIIGLLNLLNKNNIK